MFDTNAQTEYESTYLREEDPVCAAQPLVEIKGVTKTFGEKTALENLSFSVPSGQICGLLGPNGAGKTTLFRLLMGILKATKGWLFVDNYAEEYSRGMKKKLGLLLALLHAPKLLVLDEPTNGLDVESTHLFYDLISDISRQDVTVLFSTHLLDQVTRLCSHTVIINQGTLVTKGSLEQLRSDFGLENLEDIFLKLTARQVQSHE